MNLNMENMILTLNSLLQWKEYLQFDWKLNWRIMLKLLIFKDTSKNEFSWNIKGWKKDVINAKKQLYDLFNVSLFTVKISLFLIKRGIIKYC